ncbi:hypothetical protein DPEC_G00312380 [Dallia pectoralis]|uniref:Uncharacterized protein n=1 Tax=Dallia pectoralis TaxID=75939 RepID=A0ACC2FBT4_DALPE|nr:hypothetical protein DPEC_G00312380 [Dallia pectoralis]
MTWLMRQHAQQTSRITIASTSQPLELFYTAHFRSQARRFADLKVNHGYPHFNSSISSAVGKPNKDKHPTLQQSGTRSVADGVNRITQTRVQSIRWPLDCPFIEMKPPLTNGICHRKPTASSRFETAATRKKVNDIIRTVPGSRLSGWTLYGWAPESARSW